MENHWEAGSSFQPIQHSKQRLEVSESLVKQMQGQLIHYLRNGRTVQQSLDIAAKNTLGI
jgi:hypothetical protein